MRFRRVVTSSSAAGKGALATAKFLDLFQCDIDVIAEDISREKFPIFFFRNIDRLVALVAS